MPQGITKEIYHPHVIHAQRIVATPVGRIGTLNRPDRSDCTGDGDDAAVILPCINNSPNVL